MILCSFLDTTLNLQFYYKMNRHLRILLTPYFSNLDILFSQHLHENISLKRKGMKIRIIKDFDIPYKECALYYKPLLNTNQIFFQKSPIRKTCLTFKKWDKNIQTVGFNGAGTVYVTCLSLLIWNINRFSHKHDQKLVRSMIMR